MPLTVGTVTNVAVNPTSTVDQVAAATGGTAPYTYQWYRSTTSGFTPGGGNILTGVTGLGPVTDTALTPGTTYYYKVVVTDSSATALTATYTQVSAVTTAAAPSPNQFSMGTFLGTLDLHFNYNTISVQFDPTGSGSITGGMALKWTTTAGGDPKVVPSTAQADVVAGFAVFNVKDQSILPGGYLEMALAGNVMYLLATAAINRGVVLVSIPAAVAGGCNGGVAAVSGGNFPIIGYALDTASANGQLIRVMLTINPWAAYTG